MIKIIITLSILLISAILHGQTENRRAMDFFGRGYYQMERKDYFGAIISYTEAIKQDSLFLQAYENRGVAKYYIGDFAGAINDYNMALKINPYDYSTFGRRGWAKFKLQKYSEALADFDKAIEGKKGDDSYYGIRGQAKYRLQDYEGALADLTKVIKSLSAGRSKRGEALFWRAMVKIDLNQKESACADLNESKRMGYKMAGELIEIYCFKQ